MDGVGYTTVHNRLKRERGPASGWSCIFCGDPAHHWSYDHLCPDEKTAHRNGKLYPYSENLDRYQPVCRGCHNCRDKGFEYWDTCMVCTARTRHSYCPRHWVGPRRLRGLRLGHNFEPVDEHGRRRARREPDLDARSSIASTMTHKRCGRCAETLPVESFTIIKERIRRPDPYKSICLDCDRKKAAARYRAIIKNRSECN